MGIYKTMKQKGLFIVLFLFAQLLYAQDKQIRLPVFLTIHEMNDSTKILGKSFPDKGKLMLVFYDPGCGHCQELGASIDKNLKEFSKTPIFFITMYEKGLVNGYINMFAKGLKGKKNVTFWHDPGVEFIEKLNPKNYPATYIFDLESKKLIKDFQGENDAKKILPYLNK